MQPTEDSQRGNVALALGMLLTTWFGVNAVWGMTSPADTLVSAFQRGLSPLWLWVAASTALLGAAVVTGATGKHRRLLAPAIMLLAYVVGVLAGEHARDWLHPSGALLDRAFLLVPAIPMMAVWLILRPGGREHRLRLGDWSNRVQWFVRHGRRFTWAQLMVGALALLGLPLVAFSALSVRTAFGAASNLGELLATVGALSILNAFIEELLFRGLIQPGLVSYLGTKWGVWLQALLFGFVHFGASPSAIASLPTALVLVALGVLWGRSVVETGGLGWAIAFHAVLDVSTVLPIMLSS